MTAVAAKTGTWKLEIVKRAELHCFAVLPKRWVVERTFAWIARNRRLFCDFECYARTVAAFVRLAMIRVMAHRLTRPIPALESLLLGSALRKRPLHCRGLSGVGGGRSRPSGRTPAWQTRGSTDIERVGRLVTRT